MSQPYWSWGSDVFECDAPSVGPRQLRNEVAVLHHEDAGEESDKTEDGGVAESREQCVQNGKEDVQYTPPDINWDDPGVVCVTLVKFLTNPPRKIDMSTAEGECGEDVIVGVRQKRGRGKSEILGPVMKRRRAVVRETPWIYREIPNISEETPCDSLLENIDTALLLLREQHERSGNWVGSDWTILDTTFQKCAALDYKQMKAYVGKEDRQHSKGLLGMVKGEGPKLAKSWSSVNRVCLPFNLQRQKHWILLVVDLKECEIRAYDSKVDLCRTQAIQRAVQPVAKMLPWLLKESGYIGDGLLLKTEWPVIRVMDAPQQVGDFFAMFQGRLWDVHP
ncbi:unnamed protein product [Prunus armeniaca]|uniref:Ubiquitin-like protease family profile domain-containing protein n=1 Tax=Prunus armeniaca TaxID=36596 RepID=A0A6J5X9N2_PRUAR|nr:unnamed protein product [Prunus armeniaca]